MSGWPRCAPPPPLDLPLIGTPPLPPPLQNGAIFTPSLTELYHLTDGGQTLHVIRAGPEHSANYSCRAISRAGVDQQTFAVTVLSQCRHNDNDRLSLDRRDNCVTLFCGVGMRALAKTLTSIGSIETYWLLRQRNGTKASIENTGNEIWYWLSLFVCYFERNVTGIVICCERYNQWG